MPRIITNEETLQVTYEYPLLCDVCQVETGKVAFPTERPEFEENAKLAAGFDSVLCDTHKEP